MFWLGAAVSLCYIPGVTGAYIATQWPLLAVLLSFDLLRTAVLPAFGVLPKHPFTAFHAAGLAFVAYAFMLWPRSPVPYASVFGLWLTVVMALSVWFGSTAKSLRELYAGLAVGAAVSSFIAVCQYFGFSGIARASEAPAGLYVNGVQQGAVLAIIIVALVSERMWLWVPALLPGLLLANSRGSFIVLAVGLLGCYFRRLWVFGAVAAAGAFYLLTSLTNSDTERLFIWRSAWAGLTWLGLGPGVFYTIVLPKDGIYSLYPEYAHNDALQLAFEYGVGAALPFAIVGYALARTDAKEWPIVLAFVAAGCFSMPLFMPVTSFLCLAAVGRILRDYGVAGSNGSRGRQSILPGRWRRAETRERLVPVSPHHSAKGAVWR